jgi:hypothetical protein
LQKNIRHKAERKPRCAASIYRSGIDVGGKQRHSGIVALTINESFRTAADNGNSVTVDMASEEQLDWMSEDPFTPNQTSGMNGPGESRSAIDETGRALQPDATTMSSTIAIVDNNEMLDGITPSVPVSKGLSYPAGNSSATNNSNTDTLPTGSVYTCNASPELATHPSTNLHFLKNIQEALQNEGKAKGRKSLALAVWELWYSGNRPQLNGLYMFLRRFYPFMINVRELCPSDLDLSEWLAFYPRYGSRELHFHNRLPAFPKPGEVRFTWKTYTICGYAVARRKTPSSNVPFSIGRSERELVASMLLAPDGSSNLRQCFDPIFTNLQPILKEQLEALKEEVRRFEEFDFAAFASEGCSDEDSAAAMVAMVCDRELKARGVLFMPVTDDRFSVGAEFSAERALVWAVRLMLYYASPELKKSVLPSYLTARALDGCKRVLDMIHSHPRRKPQEPDTGIHGESMFDQWENTNFVNLWVHWICYDSGFFLRDSLRESV